MTINLKHVSVSILHYTIDQRYYFDIHAEIDSEIVGRATCEANDQVLHLSHFWVFPDLRKQGIGEKMIRELIAYSQDNTLFLAISLDVKKENMIAQKLYKKLGFFVSYQFNELNFTMSRPLINGYPDYECAVNRLHEMAQENRNRIESEPLTPELKKKLVKETLICSDAASFLLNDSE